MEPYYEKLNLPATRRAAKSHLKTLGKKVMHQEIMEYISYSSSVISSTGNQSMSINKVLDAMEKQRSDQESAGEYIRAIINNLNRLEKDQREALLGKYLYQWDDEEKELYMKKSLSTIKKIIREAEVDFAILMRCQVFKKEEK